MTDQSTYTGRWDKIHAPTVIKRGTGGDAFDLKGEANLGKAMAALAEAERERHRFALHNVARAGETKTFDGSSKQNRARILAAMQPGQGYLGRDLAKQVGMTGRSISSRLRAMRQAGLVTGEEQRLEPVVRNRGKKVWMTVWRRADDGH